jgi:hypothetical protein
MSKEPIAQLSHGMIGRTRVVGRTPLGLPIEESIPAVRGVYQYDADGNRVHTPTHSHRAFVRHLDEKVRPRVIKDLLEAGFLEEGVCPYTPRDALDGKPSAEPPPGFSERCDGKGEFNPGAVVGGCCHLRAIVGERRRLAKEKAAVRKPPSARQKDMNAVVAAVIAAMGPGAAAGPSSPPSEDHIAKIVAAVLAQQEQSAVPAPTAEQQEASAAAGKAALASARHRNKTGQGEV